jgi:peptidoglycan hydrolase CwlO-like protein
LSCNGNLQGHIKQLEFATNDLRAQIVKLNPQIADLLGQIGDLTLQIVKLSRHIDDLRPQIALQRCANAEVCKTVTEYLCL